MKLVTWNINGIRASKVPLKQLFDSLDADIICLQETKVTRDMLDERSAIVDGYSSYYSFSNVRTGYSGVATYVKDSCTPVKAEQGLSGCLATDDEADIGCYGDHTDFTEEELGLLDKEGRTIITQHTILDDAGKERLLTVINVYCPRADPEREDRKAFKLRFYQLLQIRAETLLNSGSHVIILGDVNMAHARIDRCDPCEPAEFVKNPGRIWLDQLLWVPDCKDVASKEENFGKPNAKKKQAKKGKKGAPSGDLSSEGVVTLGRPLGFSSGPFVDTFRYFHPDQTEQYTCWNTMIGARETNFGSRIDYILADVPLATEHFSSCEILADVMGSDHCPVRGTLTCEVRGARRCPPLCTKYFPEFVGVQTKLSAFFTKGAKRSCDVTDIVDTGGSQSDTKKVSSLPETITATSLVKVTVNKSQSFPPASKKAKLGKSSDTGKKQSSLANFFNASNNIGNPKQTDKYADKQDTQNKNRLFQNNSGVKSFDVVIPADVLPALEPVHSQKSSSSAWKNLLKGPPPAPLCKGHGEACLLRTVKKEESLNKGRQFYVCPRPEGLRTNPQARCEHFEWVEKKKKAKS